jgi:glycine/D-amino acid oxidase-like deaminating enzyme
MTLHVVGAGLSGLACALAAADAGLDVVVHEAAKQAGGRCRSWDDAVIGRRIDNGTHVVVGGNPAAMDYLRRLGARDTLRALPATPTVFDLAGGMTWRPGFATLLRALAGSLAALAFDDRGTVAGRLGRSRDFRFIWEPLAVATLNTDAARASAALFRSVLARTVWRGLGASRMHVAGGDLTASFVAPAVEALRARGVELRLGHGLREPVLRDGRVAELVFDDGTVVLSRHDAAVLAVPWWTAGKWLGLPELADSPIVNIHFRLAAPPPSLNDHEALGLVGGVAQWIFRRGDILAVTVSAAAGLDDQSNDAIAATIWAEVARALGLAGQPEAVRVVKEKRATLLHTRETEALRPGSRQGGNLFLAGDWTATGLPCTIESAIRSGNTAAADAVALLRDGAER